MKSALDLMGQFYLKMMWGGEWVGAGDMSVWGNKKFHWGESTMDDAMTPSSPDPRIELFCNVQGGIYLI